MSTGVGCHFLLHEIFPNQGPNPGIDLSCIAGRFFTYLFQIVSAYRILHDIEYSPLSYRVGPCWFSVLYILVCICKYQPVSLPFPPFLFGNHVCFMASHSFMELFVYLFWLCWAFLLPLGLLLWQARAAV